MAVSSTTNKVTYSCDGSQTVFPFTFRIFLTTDLEVIETDTDGVETTLVNGSDYDVTAPEQDFTSGGNVTTKGASSPLPATSELTINRVQPLTQLVDYTENDAFPAETHEQALDKLTMIAQQLDEKIVRNLSVPITDSEPGLLPNATDRANLFLAFDGSGDPITATAATGATVTAAAQTVLDDTTIAAMRTTLDVYSQAESDDLGAKVTITAGENLTKGWPVGRLNDEYVQSKFAWGLQDESLISTNTPHYHAMADLGDGLFVIVYRDGTAANNYARVGHWDGSTLTWKTSAYTLDITTQNFEAVCRVADTSNGPAFAAFYGGNGYLQFFEYNTGTPAIAELTDALDIATAGSPGHLCHMGSNYVACVWELSGTTIELRILRYDGTSTIEATTSAATVASATAVNPRVCYIGGNRVAICGHQTTIGEFVVVWKWDGATSIATDSTTECRVMEGNNGLQRDVVRIADNTFAWVHPSLDAVPRRPEINICKFGPDSTSLGTISYSASYSIKTVVGSHTQAAYIGNNRIVITGEDSVTYTYYAMVVQWRDGGIVPIIPWQPITTSNAAGFIEVAAFGEGMFLVSTKQGTTSGLYLHIGHLPTFLGVIEDTVTDGNTEALVLQGKISGLSGLTEGSNYYVDFITGLLEEEGGDVQAGLAFSATEMLVK